MRPTLLALEDRQLLSTFTVTDTSDNPSDTGSLRHAIDQANANNQANTINFGPLFNTPQTITLTGTELELSDTGGLQTITGPAAGVTVSADGASRVFQVDSGVTANFSGLSITGGSTESSGGGVLVNGGMAALTDCKITGNSAGVGSQVGADGAGLANQGGNVTLTDCTVSGNSAEESNGGGGGGVATLTNGTTTLIDSTISDNSSAVFSANGVGLLELGADSFTTLTDCTISGNTASGGGGGGGVGDYGGTLVMTGCNISGNSGSLGGGLSVFATAVLTNCTISGNSAEDGGGVFSLGSLSLTNCTISNNSGGGVFSQGTTLNMNNTIVAGNTQTDLTDFAGSPTGSNNLIGGDPVLAPLGNYGGPTQTMPEFPGSPALGAGSVALAVDPQGNPLTTDQRGMPRATNGSVDIGAFQSEGFTFTVVPGSTPQTAPIGTEFANPLAVTVKANNPTEPVDGGVITFVPHPAANGATAIFVAPTAKIANGTAALTAAPNNFTGSYTVVGSAPGFSASFQLTNVGTPFAALVVNSTSDSIAPGPGLLSLREAIGFANTDPSGNSTISFDKKVFKRPQVITLTGNQLELSNTTGTETIVGPKGGVTINGSGASRVFQVDGGVTADFIGLTITGGSTSGNGGGLYNDGGSVTLTDCTVSGNSAVVGGGGVDQFSGSLTLTNCTVSDNTASTYYGGGVRTQNGAATLTNCTISGNAVNSPLFGKGGGVDLYGTAITLTDCTISGNTATGIFATGGGAFIAGTMNTLTDCKITGNSTTGFDGGLNLSFGTMSTLTGCTISGNTAYDRGGMANYGTATLTNCIVSGNSTNSPYAGGGSGHTRPDDADWLHHQRQLGPGRWRWPVHLRRRFGYADKLHDQR